jgi:hypothetical protein
MASRRRESGIVRMLIWLYTPARTLTNAARRLQATLEMCNVFFAIVFTAELLIKVYAQP